MSHSFCAPSPSPAPYSEAPNPGNEYLVNIISGVAAVVLVSLVLVVVITYMVTKWSTKKKLLSTQSSTQSSDFSPDSCEVHWYNCLWLLFIARCMCTVNKIWLCPCLIASPDPWWGAFKRHQYQGSTPMSCEWIWAAVPSAWLCPFGSQEWVHSILHIVQQMLLTNGPVRFGSDIQKNIVLTLISSPQHCSPLSSVPDLIYMVLDLVPVLQVKQLVRSLGVKDTEIEQVELDYRSCREAHYQMLRVWAEKGSRAGGMLHWPLLQELLDELRKMHLEQAAEELETNCGFQ